MQLAALPEGAAPVAMHDDRLGQRRAETRDARQQRCRCRVQLDADRVDGILDHRIQAAGQAMLVDVVLVLADADALRARS